VKNGHQGQKKRKETQATEGQEKIGVFEYG